MTTHVADLIKEMAAMKSEISAMKDMQKIEMREKRIERESIEVGPYRVF